MPRIKPAPRCPCCRSKLGPAAEFCTHCGAYLCPTCGTWRPDPKFIRHQCEGPKNPGEDRPSKAEDRKMC